MKGRSQQRRATVAALGAMVCLNFGCASTVSRSAATSNGETRARAPSQAPPYLTLTADQERRAEALARYASGVSLEWSGGLDAAMPEYAKSFELDPHHIALGTHLAQVYLGRKDYTNAVSLLETAIKANPNAPELWFWLGITYQGGEQSQKALSAFRQTLKLNPKYLDGMRELLKIYLEQGPISEAIAVLDHAWRQQSKDASYWISVGDLYTLALKQKPSLASQVDRARVVQCYEKALTLSARDPEVLWRLAGVYLDANDFKMAADMFSKLLALRPDAPQVRERLALIYIQAGEKEKAISALEEIIKRDPLRFETYNALGDLYDDLNKEERAISNYQQSLVLNPNQIEVYVRIAYAQLRLNKYDDALQTLGTAKEKFPRTYWIPYLYGLTYSDQKQYNRAVESFADAETLARESSEEDKPNSEFYFSFGAACERAGDTDKAATLFNKSIELDPDNHAALNYLGYMWADKGIRLDEALKLINKAVALDSNSGAYIDSLGWVLYKMGRYEEALSQLRRAAELIKDDSVVYDHLAELLIKLGKQDEAIAQWRRAHEIDPDNKEITEKLDKYTGKHTSAE
ncbi:MAG: tetratricopeptide repeat protein [Verrucomicrobiia bacterium]|jgi:tetratricopeptide (TPR) repeat protein